MSSFRRGFRNRNPLVLLAAAALLVPALLGFEYLFTSGAWTVVPLDRALRRAEDSFTYVSWTVGKNRRVPPDVPCVYLTGGSSAREAIVGGPQLAAEVRRQGGPRIQAYDLGFINQNLAETYAIADTVPDSPAWVLVGVNLGRFTATPEVNEQQIVGRDLLLKSRALQQYVSGTFGRYTYSFTILPGIFSYLTSYAKQDGKAALDGRWPSRRYRQHNYTTVFNAKKKESLVQRWNRTRYPVFKRNLAYNLAMLEQVLERCRERGVHAVLVELPINEEAVQGRFDRAIAAYRKPAQAMARRYGAPYLDFNAQIAIPSSEFHDLSHLVAPGRVTWQLRLAEELARLLNDAAQDGSSQS